MKKIFKFSKLFIPAALFSCAVICFGIFGLIKKGLNFGIDFQAGFIAQVRLAPTTATIRYSGPKTFTFSQDSKGLYLVITSVSEHNESINFLFSEYETVGEFAKEANKIDGITVDVISNPDVKLYTVFTGSQQLSRLSDTPLSLHYLDDSMELVSADDVRQDLSFISGLTLQQVGDPNEKTFQFRLSDDGSHENSSEYLYNVLTEGLSKKYGNDNFAYLSTDFTGSQFSGALVKQSIILVLFAMIIIFLYVMFRFKWDFALGSIIALIHDVLFMVAFIVWTRMEFSTSTVAALLTIIGYSINNTVVLFDRVRENSRLFPTMISIDVLNKSLSDVLGRSMITSLTTLAAMFALYIFTSDTIHLFALAVIVGIISGTYSSLYIAPWFISMTTKGAKGHDIIKSKIPGQSKTGAVV